jgi:hypothetical protein
MNNKRRLVTFEFKLYFHIFSYTVNALKYGHSLKYGHPKPLIFKAKKNEKWELMAFLLNNFFKKR